MGTVIKEKGEIALNADSRKISDIFNMSRILEIPFFQRSYVWEEEQWQRFLDDMENLALEPEPFFMGTIILKQRSTSAEQDCGDIRTVIDGQQRLTTITLFFKVLSLMNGPSNAFDRFRLMKTGEIALRHNHNDLESFNTIVELDVLEDIPGENNIVGAYKFFKDNINPDRFDFYRLIENIEFVGIDLTESEDEQQIFDTINSLGVKLTTAELLKNFFFDRNDIKSYELNWKNVFEFDEEAKEYWDKEITAGRIRRTCIDLFFHAFLQIKIQDDNLKIRAENKKQFSRVEKLFESYKKFIAEYYDNDKQALVDEIRAYAILFRQVFNPEIVNQSIPRQFGIERVNLLIFGLDTSTLIPYVLYVEKNQDDINVKNELYRTIESYIMRRMVVRSTTKNYNQLFSERLIYNNILTREQFLSYIATQSEKINRLPSIQEMVEGFNKSRLINKQAKGVIYLIEAKIRDGSKHATQLLGFDKYSLEHLMPKKWENHWGMPNPPYTPEERNSKLLTLGNLAIITQSLNASIRDSKWTAKLQGDGKRAGLKKYAEGIETIGDYLDYLYWDEDTIKERAKYLSDKAISIWGD